MNESAEFMKKPSKLSCSKVMNGGSEVRHLGSFELASWVVVLRSLVVAVPCRRVAHTALCGVACDGDVHAAIAGHMRTQGSRCSCTPCSSGPS